MESSLLLFCDTCGGANETDATHCFVCHLPLTPLPLPMQPVQAMQPSGKHVALPALIAAGPLPPGSLLVQRYRIISQVGQGGFAVVYKAKDTQKKNKVVAIKQINLHALASKDLFEATSASKREVELLSDLDHANLPHIYDRFSDPWHRYIVMDFIQGETLEDYLSEVRRGYLSVREVLKIGIELSTVLSYLHAQFPPIIFRDVKPANIMRTRRGRLYLIDFGIARHVNRGQKDTAPLGSPGYAAPEQYGKAQTTERTDIYGLGATLQALLTGEDP